MPPPPKKPKSAAAREQAAEVRATAAAQKIIFSHLPQVMAELSASGSPMMPVSGNHMTIALPVAGQQTMVAALRNRPNWYAMPRKHVGQLARLVSKRNWFVRKVLAGRFSVYSMGFRFAGEEAQAWAESGTYDFAQMQEDMILEWLVSDAVVGWWSKNTEEGALPVVNITNLEEVEYEVIGGIPQITIEFPRSTKLPDSFEEKLGKRLFDAIKKGKKLIIPKGDTDFDFQVMKAGKSAENGFDPSAMIGIFDDLDFIEAIRVGDWNGAKARWEIIRHTKKGSGITSGNNAGSTRNNAKTAELKMILKSMKEIYGKIDIATNYDQEIDWKTFPKEHFHADLLLETKQRLLFWSGVFGILLMKSDAQISGLAAFLMEQLRTEVLSFRQRFSRFLRSIYQSDSFRQGIPNMPELVPQWSDQALYTVDAFNKLITTLATYGLAAPQTLRELFGIDEAEESRRMLATHEYPQRYTPPFEPRQGIASAFTVPETPGGNQKQQALPGEGGRPSNS